MQDGIIQATAVSIVNYDKHPKNSLLINNFRSDAGFYPQSYE